MTMEPLPKRSTARPLTRRSSATAQPTAAAAQPRAATAQSINLLPAQLDLSIYAGDSLTVRFEFQDAGGAAVDMTGTWSAQIRHSGGNLTDPPVGSFTIDDSSAATGIISASLSGDDTAALPVGASLPWDMQQITTGGAVRTTHRGAITVTQDVTRP
jgi:hypothetical protein